ncbi:hypothetical protein DFH08DRAFT_818508 [Mycena albidolilacea]|uniref:Endonuclease/exonuclease/phosphatase domain-containing protein n=1 Tax=Mycena albidolilacea TaxID=1033008 RepID=A0AAD6ZG72_9AGAR|nr:hypothetical protein DFH08DRAFT_818508 [Mycena albidolilacea]
MYSVSTLPQNPMIGAIQTLCLFLSILFPLPPNHSSIIFGDFNKHHVLWTGLGTATPPPCQGGDWLTINLVFASKEGLAAKLIKCATLPGHGWDPTAVFAKFNVAFNYHEIPLCRNFHEADWDEFPAWLEAHLAANLAANPLPQLPLSTGEEIDTYTEALTCAFIPRTKPTAVEDANHKECVPQHNPKRAHWCQYISDLLHTDIWKAANYTLDPTALTANSRIPDLHMLDGSVATTPEQKAKTLGPSGIPKIAITAACCTIAPILNTILETGLRLGYFPAFWQIFLTVSLCKLGKSNYTV